MLLIHLLPHTLLTVLRESPALALKALFSSSLGCRRGERSQKVCVSHDRGGDFN